jgi:chaperone required for assembly of F1-ATPase
MPEKEERVPAAANGAPRTASHRKRFYSQVAIKDEGAGQTSLLLDGKPVRTPGKALLLLPNAALAEAVGAEWRAQGPRIDPSTMPLTRLANSVIDGVVGSMQAVIDDILGYAGSDLVCYRAEVPEALVALQTKHWDPVIAWAKTGLDAPLERAEGVTHVAQPQASLDEIARRLEGFDPWSLAALHVMTGLTGSALLALAVVLHRLSPDEAWAAAHIDEDWQIGQWSEDAEAKRRRANRRRDFDAAARMLELLAA